MRAWVAIALVAFLAMAAPAARADDGVPAQARQQTFVVQVAFDEEHGAIGAGVLVARDGDVLTLATAEHVVSEKGTLQILDVTRRNYYRVIDIQTLPDYDLALIRVYAQPDFTAEPVQIGDAAAGEPVTVLGNTGDGFWEPASGTVLQTSAQIPGVFGSPRITIACDACSFGDSGSGVFDSQGRLLGILTRAWRKKNGPVLFIEVEPAALIRQELLARR
ncbi:MAG TPA: serine protease [Candidatus Baltobacteraceae bacterium]|nr:serine protease [Candidatus Baltobacteraceae bacterium]